MSKPLNFNKLPKKYLTVTLNDEKETVLFICTPTKAIMDQIILLQSSLESFRDGDANLEAIDDLYTACAKIMSRNKTGVVITKEFISELFDFEDITIFFNAYIAFVQELSNEKN